MNDSIADPDTMNEGQENTNHYQDEMNQQQEQGLKDSACDQLQCPRRFIFVPEGGNGFISKTYRLYFLCSYDYTLVRTEAKKWFKNVAPLIKVEEELEDVMEWLSNCQDLEDLNGFIRARESELASQEAYLAIALEACKPNNKGWMNDMEIASYKNHYEWVKKTNVPKWIEHKKKKERQM